jgi:hypothetical protein
MKKLSIIAAAFAAATSALSAQSFTPSAGYSSVKLFDTPVGQTISGLDFDSARNAYYLVGNGTSLPTHLEVRSAADSYVTPTVLFDYGAAKFGSFVRLQSDKLYFGESTNGTIRVRDLTLGTTSLLATIANNYDLDFGGGVGWLSADPGFVGNRIFKLDLSTGATTQVLNSTDFSGPVALDASGRLYYGATAFGAGGNVYQYSAAEANAGGLTLDAGHVLSSNSGNAYFDLDPLSGLYQTDFSTVKLLNLTTGTVASVGSTSDTIGNLASIPGLLALAMTNYAGPGSADDRSSVFAVVPEPSSVLLLAFAAAGLTARRRR